MGSLSRGLAERQCLQPFAHGTVEATDTRAHAQDRDKNLLSQLQKLKTEKKDIEEDVRQMVLIMEDRRAELTKQREAYEQVLFPRVLSPTPVD